MNTRELHAEIVMLRRQLAASEILAQVVCEVFRDLPTEQAARVRDALTERMSAVRIARKERTL